MFSRHSLFPVIPLLILVSCDKAALPQDIDTFIPIGKIDVTSTNGSTTILSGQTLQLTASVSPANVTNPSLIWRISDPTTALITSSGLVTALIAGTVTAKATANDRSGISGSMTVTIDNEPNGDPLALFKKIYGATSIY